MGSQKRRKPRQAQEYARASNGRRHRRKHKKNHMILYILLMIFVLGAGFFLTFNVFFKVEGFEISGSDKYTQEQVIETSGIALGDNLFKIDTGKVEASIIAALPYIESVKVSRKLPTRLGIALTEAQVVGAVQVGEANFCLLSQGGKIVEVGAVEAPEGAAVISGLSIENPEVGTYLTSEADAERIAILNQLTEALSENELLADVTLIDLTSPVNLYFTYKNALKVELGSRAELSYKVAFVKEVMKKENIENQEGLIDATGTMDKTKPNVRFRAGDFQEIMGYVTTTPPVTTAAPASKEGQTQPPVTSNTPSQTKQEGFTQPSSSSTA